MNEKYKELPAFETNQFEVGDEVNAYGELCYTGLTIRLIEGNYLVFNRTDHCDSKIHFKACRKLEEIKPREFWIKQSDIPFYNIENISYTDEELRFSGFIKIREVLDE